MMYDTSIEWSQDKSTLKQLQKEKETGKCFLFQELFSLWDKLKTVYITSQSSRSFNHAWATGRVGLAQTCVTSSGLL